MRRLIAASCALLTTALFAQERDVGEQLYNDGIGATAILAGGALERPATGFACAGCHGADAMGNREGSTQFPPLLTSDGGAISVIYTADELRVVLEDGTTPQGRHLSPIMPRYRADGPTVSALHVYLSALAVAGRVGVAASSLLIGPPTDPRAKRSFELALRQANDAGGAWSRRFEISSASTVLVSADEAEEILQEGIDRSVAQAVAGSLVRLGITVVAADKVKDGIRPMLSQYGIEIDPDAKVRLRMHENTARLFVDDAETEVFALSSLMMEATDIAVDERFGYLVGREIAQAALACGRSVTKRCVLDRLRSADLAR